MSLSEGDSKVDLKKDANSIEVKTVEKYEEHEERISRQIRS